MKTFYRPVNCRSRKDMTEYLREHFRYPTMSSWNDSTSYACNLKIYQLGLDSDTVDKLFELIQTDDFFQERSLLIQDFGSAHDYLWQAGMNGRSGGYLVLYQGERIPSGYKSYCTNCGQKSYRSVQETGNVCGVCRKPARVDFPGTHMQVTTFPGRGTDCDADFEDWSMYDLRNRVRLVQEFDRLADDMVQEAVFYAQNYAVQDEEYQVTQTRKALVPVG
ncbi:MAG: hypothetical protein K2P33_04400 [Acutalibacter sp.]|nr:hypothetical protein [Acutalibacter sp.]